LYVYSEPVPNWPRHSEIHTVIRLLKRFYRTEKVVSIKNHFATTKQKMSIYLSIYLYYLFGWVVAALPSELGPLSDQSMHDKTLVVKLVNEFHTFLYQADRG
jgi:isocitrate lyase